MKSTLLGTTVQMKMDNTTSGVMVPRLTRILRHLKIRSFHQTTHLIGKTTVRQLVSWRLITRQQTTLLAKARFVGTTCGLTYQVFTLLVFNYQIMWWRSTMMVSHKSLLRMPRVVSHSRHPTVKIFTGKTSWRPNWVCNTLMRLIHHTRHQSTTLTQRRVLTSTAWSTKLTTVPQTLKWSSNNLGLLRIWQKPKFVKRWLLTTRTRMKQNLSLAVRARP